MKTKTPNITKNNIIIGLSVLAVSLIATFSFSGATASGGLVGVEEFMTKYQSTPGAVLIDVRTPAEFEGGHINGAINIDFENPNFEQEVQKLDISKTYFIYCRSGSRSSKASVILRKEGFKNLYELQRGVSSKSQLLM